MCNELPLEGQYHAVHGKIEMGDSDYIFMTRLSDSIRRVMA